MEKATRVIINGLATQDVDHVIPHQANVRIVEAWLNAEIPLEKFSVI